MEDFEHEVVVCGGEVGESTNRKCHPKNPVHTWDVRNFHPILEIICMRNGAGPI